ncbi:TetR/AcrR family transcriptional regulator [Nocardia sp. NPDC052278]|uniref:TetR/AcrR family transcriptional regulator n=1 Tax=unclassified Nocardia TaxID=2637762 RepID=UPI0036883466
MRRAFPEVGRAKFIAAGMRVVAREGIDSTTARKIAQEAGTSLGMVHHFFASMEKLLISIFEHAARERIRNALLDYDFSESTPTAGQVLKRIVHAYRLDPLPWDVYDELVNRVSRLDPNLARKCTDEQVEHLAEVLNHGTDSEALADVSTRTAVLILAISDCMVEYRRISLDEHTIFEMIDVMAKHFDNTESKF